MKKVLIILILPIILFTSCKGKDDLYDANKKILEMKSYSTKADITVFSNKGISNYKVKHLFKAPDKIRIETIEPDFLKGKILVSQNGKWKIYHPLINQSFEISKFEESEGLILLGILQKSILSDENAKYDILNKDGAEYIRIKAKISDGNIYRSSIVVLLSKERYIPECLEIYDSNNKLTVSVRYAEFKYDVEIDDSQFIL